MKEREPTVPQSSKPDGNKMTLSLSRKQLRGVLWHGFSTFPRVQSGYLDDLDRTSLLTARKDTWSCP